jgi:hypothetical protein
MQTPEVDPSPTFTPVRLVNPQKNQALILILLVVYLMTLPLAQA